MYQINNLVTFSGELVGHEEFLNCMAEAFNITIDRRSKRRPRKRESLAIDKKRCVAPFLIKNIEGERKSDIARPLNTLTI